MRSEDIDFELAPQLFLAKLFHSTEGAEACVIDENIDTAEVMLCLLNCAVNTLSVGDVELERQNEIAVFFAQIFQRLRTAAGSRDLVTTLQSSFDKSAAEPAICTSDEPYLLCF
jgi:hypothetical protein